MVNNRKLTIVMQRCLFTLKKVVLSQSRGWNDNPPPKYTPHEKMYYFTTKKARDRKVPRKYEGGDRTSLFFPGRLYQGYKLAQNLHNSMVNISHTWCSLHQDQDQFFIPQLVFLVKSTYLGISHFWRRANAWNVRFAVLLRYEILPWSTRLMWPNLSVSLRSWAASH